MKKLLWLIAILLLSAFRPATADVLVLVHGYLGSAQSWAESGALARLRQRGYQPVGIYGYSGQGILYQRLGERSATRPVYAVNLPSQAPVVIQADWLGAYLREIRKHHPEQAINVAAHSAGGVVARGRRVRAEV